MSIHVALNHVTHYRYDRPINLGPQVVRLRPAPHSRTRILSYSMRVEPADALHQLAAGSAVELPGAAGVPGQDERVPHRGRSRRRDVGAQPVRLLPRTLGRELPVRVRRRSSRTNSRPTASRPPLTPAFETLPWRHPAREDADHQLPRRAEPEAAEGHRLPDPHGARRADARGRRWSTAAARAATRGWLLVQLLRHLGFAARFVSGYLIQLKSDVKSLDGPSGTEVDFTDLHAWCEVYLPGAGWIGFDPTSGLLAGEGHIPLACSPDPGSAAPVTGALEDCETDVRAPHEGLARLGSAARHAALHRRAVGRDRGARPPGRRRPAHATTCA